MMQLSWNLCLQVSSENYNQEVDWCPHLISRIKWGGLSCQVHMNRLYGLCVLAVVGNEMPPVLYLIAGQKLPLVPHHMDAFNVSTGFIQANKGKHVIVF